MKKNNLENQKFGKKIRKANWRIKKNNGLLDKEMQRKGIIMKEIYKNKKLTKNNE